MKQETKNLELLRNENASLNKQLEKLNQKLKESDAFKSHFLSNITNEIINPFTSILGISKSIMKLGSDKIGQVHSMANLIFNEAFDLDFQLQNIFAAAKIESGEINLELSSVEPYDDIMAMIEEIRFKAEKKSQYIELVCEKEVPHNFVTDKDKIQIIIKNLLSNAIIFGDEKTKISIWIGFNKGKLQIEVNNKGNLLDKEDIQAIFDRFTKLDKTINSINQGHGLGLSVSKAYLDLLNGSIEVESSNENGNTFKIHLPPTESEPDSLIRDDDLFIDDSEIFLTNGESAKDVHISGKAFASQAPYYLSTILGSCVAVCLYDDVKKIGGMNHFMLPLWNGEGLASPKYGNVAIELLIDKMLKLGCKKRYIKAKIFGGASVIKTKHDLYNIGERNIQIAEDILEQENIKIIARSIGGDRGRKILMDTSNFQIRHKYVEKKHF